MHDLNAPCVRCVGFFFFTVTRVLLWPTWLGPFRPHFALLGTLVFDPLGVLRQIRQIQGLRLEQTTFSEPHSRRECRHVPASREKAKTFLLTRHSRHPRNGINKTTSSFAGAVLVRSAFGQNRDSVQKFCTASFPDFDQDSFEVKCKKGSDNARLVFQSNATCQQFLAANSG